MQASMIGSILSNTLLVLGMCYFAGGLRFHEQLYQVAASQLQISLLGISIAAIILPAGEYTLFVQDAKGELIPLFSVPLCHEPQCCWSQHCRYHRSREWRGTTLVVHLSRIGVPPLVRVRNVPRVHPVHARIVSLPTPNEVPHLTLFIAQPVQAPSSRTTPLARQVRRTPPEPRKSLPQAALAILDSKSVVE